MELSLLTSLLGNSKARCACMDPIVIGASDRPSLLVPRPRLLDACTFAPLRRGKEVSGGYSLHKCQPTPIVQQHSLLSRPRTPGALSFGKDISTARGGNWLGPLEQASRVC